MPESLHNYHFLLRPESHHMISLFGQFSWHFGKTLTENLCSVNAMSKPDRFNTVNDALVSSCNSKKTIYTEQVNAAVSEKSNWQEIPTFWFLTCYFVAKKRLSVYSTCSTNNDINVPAGKKNISLCMLTHLWSYTNTRKHKQLDFILCSTE